MLNTLNTLSNKEETGFDSNPTPMISSLPLKCSNCQETQLFDSNNNCWVCGKADGKPFGCPSTNGVSG